MSDGTVLREGRASVAASVAMGVVALLIFGGLSAVCFLEVTPWFGWPLAVLAAISIPWQLLDARTRRHRLTERGLEYRCGVLGRYEVEVPYSGIRGVTVHQSGLQRLFRVGSVRVSAPGVAGPVKITSLDLNSVLVRSIPDFAEVAAALRERVTPEP